MTVELSLHGLAEGVALARLAELGVSPSDARMAPFGPTGRRWTVMIGMHVFAVDVDPPCVETGSVRASVWFDDVQIVDRRTMADVLASSPHPRNNLGSARVVMERVQQREVIERARDTRIVANSTGVLGGLVAVAVLIGGGPLAWPLAVAGAAVIGAVVMRVRSRRLVLRLRRAPHDVVASATHALR